MYFFMLGKMGEVVSKIVYEEEEEKIRKLLYTHLFILVNSDLLNEYLVNSYFRFTL